MKFSASALLTLVAVLSLVSAIPLERRAPPVVPDDSTPVNAPNDSNPENAPGDSPPINAPNNSTPINAPNDSTPPFVPGALFDRIFIVILENKDYKQAAANSYFVSLAKKGTLLTNYHGVTHPSQPNYITMISGSTQGFRDSIMHDFKAKNLVDLLEAKGVSWKTYQENYPGNCYRKEDADDELYVRKHNPFISFTSISNNKDRCAKIVNAKQLDKDLANNDLPQYSFYTPNMKNDGHDSSVKYMANWLKGFIEPKLANPYFTNNTVILVTFDEDDSEMAKNKNHVYAILLGGAVRSPPGTQDNTNYDHHSVLATIEQNWDLGNLNQGDVDATLLKNLGKAQ